MEHETFDEYLEMIITFGYVTLFACKITTMFDIIIYSCVPNGVIPVDHLHIL